MAGMSDNADRRDTKQIVLQPVQRVSENLAPEELLHKENVRIIAKALSSLVNGDKSDNLFICGKSGTGKTTVVKCLISSLEGKGMIVPVYLNCHEYCTKMAFFSKISFRMGNPVPRRGFAFYEVFEHIRKMLDEEKKKLLLILDDFDSLKPSEAFEILHPVVDTLENGCNSITIFAIGSDFKRFEELDAKIKGALMFRIVEFEPFSKEELGSLLEAVAKRTLLEGSWSPEIMEKVAELGLSGEGNARFAIWLLFSAGRGAEERNSEKIELDDVLKAYERILPARTSNPDEEGLCEEELLILDILRGGERDSSEIYEIILKKVSRSKRQIRNYLGSLVQKGHIEARELDDSNSVLKPKVYRVCQRRLDEVYD